MATKYFALYSGSQQPFPVRPNLIAGTEGKTHFLLYRYSTPSYTARLTQHASININGKVKKYFTLYSSLFVIIVHVLGVHALNNSIYPTRMLAQNCDRLLITST
mgnify:FL=1